MTTSDAVRAPEEPGPGTAGTPPLRTGRPGRLRRADVAVAVGSVCFLVLLLLPWVRVPAYDLGFGYRAAATSANGFSSGLLVAALVLLVLATAWTVLSSVGRTRVPFPPGVVTAVCAAAAFLLTLVEWLAATDQGFPLVGLLAVLTAAAVLVLAVLRLLADLPGPAPLPRPVAATVAWAARPVSRSGGAPALPDGAQQPPPDAEHSPSAAGQDPSDVPVPERRPVDEPSWDAAAPDDVPYTGPPPFLRPPPAAPAPPGAADDRPGAG